MERRSEESMDAQEQDYMDLNDMRKFYVIEDDARCKIAPVFNTCKDLEANLLTDKAIVESR